MNPEIEGNRAQAPVEEEIIRMRNGGRTDVSIDGRTGIETVTTTMTRQRMYIMTAIAAALYVALGIIFADGFFTGTFWSSESIFGSSYVSWVLLAVIVAAGI